MVKIYVRKILDQSCNFTVDDVPEFWKQKVKEELRKQLSVEQS